MTSEMSCRRSVLFPYFYLFSALSNVADNDVDSAEDDHVPPSATPSPSKSSSTPKYVVFVLPPNAYSRSTGPVLTRNLSLIPASSLMRLKALWIQGWLMCTGPFLP